MQQILYKFLVLHSEVSIAGLGTFKYSRRAAKHDFVNDVFIAPTYTFNFTASASETTNELYRFIALEKNCSVETARAAWQQFTARVNGDLELHQQFDLKELGRLFVDNDGILSYEAVQTPAYFPDIMAARVSRPGMADMILVDNSAQNGRHELEKVAYDKPAVIKHSERFWWAYAIVFALAAIAAIVYYYLQNGTIIQ